jgi:hypothetical protein
MRRIDGGTIRKTEANVMAVPNDLGPIDVTTADLERELTTAFEYPNQFPKLPSLRVLWDFAKQLSRDDDVARREASSTVARSTEG